MIQYEFGAHWFTTVAGSHVEFCLCHTQTGVPGSNSWYFLSGLLLLPCLLMSSWQVWCISCAPSSLGSWGKFFSLGVHCVIIKQPRIQLVRNTKNIDTCIQTVRSSPVRTRSMMTNVRKSAHKKWLISGQPSKLFARNYVFQVHRHILRKHCHHIYIKCRVKGCNLAYVSFNRVKDLNAHHQLYHPNSHYKFHQCKKTVHTPSTWRYHQYCQCPRLHKCGDCNKFFLFKSTLEQHHRSHISQRLFKCFHGGCYMRYKHPQDLSQHAATHQQITYDCDSCDKTFKQKCLLKHH